jgi:copper transport outer membrane protein MctB
VINFRFHLVSLIAVFLAMGLGILVGSTVVDQVIVDRLDREIRDVSHESNQLKSENSRLGDQVSQLNDFLQKSSAYAVQNRLDGVPVAIVAEKGVDGSAVSSLLSTVKASGAVVPGVFWLTDKWRLDSPKDVQDLQKAVHVSGTVAAVRMGALRALATQFAVPESDASGGPDAVDALRSAGFLDFDGKKSALDTFPARRARVLYVTGTDSHLGATDTLLDTVQGALARQSSVVVGEVYDAKGGDPSAPKRGAMVEPVRGDPALGDSVSTLDDVELAQGPLTAVLALQQLGQGVVGHYGYGSGAHEPIPALSP